jgi:hypothetical protein
VGLVTGRRGGGVGAEAMASSRNRSRRAFQQS